MTRSTTLATSLHIFETYLKNQVGLPQQAWQDLVAISKPSQVYKKDIFVSEGQAFNNEVFIVEGIR